MNGFAADYLANLTAELTAKVLDAAGKRVREQLVGTEKAQALQRCIEAGVYVLLASASEQEPETVHLLQEIFTNFFDDDAVAGQLGKLLRGRSLDREDLRDLFEQAGYDAGTLPGLHFEEGLAAFEAAFVAAAMSEDALQGVIEAGALVEQTAIQRALLEEMRKLVDSLRGSVSAVSVRAGEIRVQDAEGRPKIIYGHGNVLGDNSQSHVEQYYGPVATGPGGRAIQAETYIEAVDLERQKAERAKTLYLKRLYQRCNVLPLAALGGEEGVGDEVTLEQVYIALDTKTKIPFSEEEKKQLRKQTLFREEETRSLAALEAAMQAPHMVLLGDPGSGKSTFVRQVMACLAASELGERAALPGWEPGLLPVLLLLRELAPALAELALAGLSEEAASEKLVGAVRQHIAAVLGAEKSEAWDHCLEDALADGAVVLFLDGLDEVAEACRERVRQAVCALLHVYPIKRVVITCRTRSYTGAAVLPGFAAHTLAPFDREKIRAFVGGWYQAQVSLGRLNEAQAQDRAKDLQRAALGDQLRELSSNPMLLTTMAIIHQREVGLPRERVRLYSQAVQVLLNCWQKRKGIAVSDSLAALLADDLKLRSILERLAYTAHQGEACDGKKAGLARGDLLAFLEQDCYLGDAGLASDFLDYVDQRAGLLVGQGGDGAGGRPQMYAFPHRTFQEYLAGSYMVGQRGMLRTYLQRAAEGDFWHLSAQLGAEELFYNRRSPKDLLDLAYALCPGRAPEDITGWRAALWSGEMAALLGKAAIEQDTECPDGGPAYVARLIPRLVQIVRESPLGPIERAEAGNILAKLGDPRFRADAWYLPDEPLLGFVEIPEGAFVMGEDEDAHRLTLPTYYIGRYPVTVAQFRAFVDAGGYQDACYWEEARAAGVWQDGKIKGRWDDDPREGTVDYRELFGLPNHPMVGITWYEALAYCRWLTERLRGWAGTPEPLAALLKEQKWQVTLPSEAEWEKTAAWDAGAGKHRQYPWGEPLDPNLVNYDETGIGATSAVGCFPGGCSASKVEELSGNVWEWTRSVYKRYPYDVSDGRENLAAGDAASRVLRGGAFYSNERRVRCAYRLRYNPSDRGNYCGFRVVVSPITSDLCPSGL